MYFAGLTKCFSCEMVGELPENEQPGWRAIIAEEKVYYFCDRCSPEKTASVSEWTNFYVESVRKINEKDFNRPIKKVKFVRDGGKHAIIINPDAQLN
jgi:hypothetical protein